MKKNFLFCIVQGQLAHGGKMSYLVLWEKIDKYFKQHGMITFIVLCMFILLFYLTYQVSNHIPTEIREVKEDIKEVKIELKEDIKELRIEVKEDIKELRIELKEDIKEIKNGQDMIINHLLNNNKKGQ